MPAMLIPVIINLAMQILGFVIKKIINNKELTKAFEGFSELVRTENIKTILARQNAEKQLEAGSNKWDEIEKNQKGK